MEKRGMDLKNDEIKGRNLASGVRFSESARSVFSPMGYRLNELSKNDGIWNKKAF